MDVTPQELRSSEIKDSWRGYDRDEVDDLLERAAVTIESLSQKVEEAAHRGPIAAAAAVSPEPVPLPSSRDDAEMLQRTLLLAQRAADDAVNEAQAHARQLVDEADAKAQALVGDAEATARRIAEGERRRLEAEIQDLSSRREQLRADADALDEYASGYRDRLRAAIEADLANLGATVEPPSARPELHDVEIPIDLAPEPDRGVESPTSSWDSGSETRAPDGFETGTASAAEAPARVAAPPRPAPAPAPARQQAPAAEEWPPPAPAAGVARAATAESTWLPADDSWAAEQELDAPAPWERDTAHHDAFASEVPMEANTVDTDSLSDDAFFASLREAVRDEVPLGPVDETQGDFFDGEAEDDRRRFRRRR